MSLKMIDLRGVTHFEGEDYLPDNVKGKIFMTNRCNIPRKVVSDSIEDGKRIVVLMASKHE
jgi:hypothetical protein